MHHVVSGSYNAMKDIELLIKQDRKEMMELHGSNKVLKTKSSTKSQPAYQSLFQDLHLTYSPEVSRSRSQQSPMAKTESIPSFYDDEEQDYEQIKKEMILEIPMLKKKINTAIQREASTLEEINDLQVLLAASIKENKGQLISAYQTFLSENRKQLEMINQERQRLEKSLKMNHEICFKLS